MSNEVIIVVLSAMLFLPILAIALYSIYAACYTRKEKIVFLSIVSYVITIVSLMVYFSS